MGGTVLSGCHSGGPASSKSIALFLRCAMSRELLGLSDWEEAITQPEPGGSVPLLRHAVYCRDAVVAIPGSSYLNRSMRTGTSIGNAVTRVSLDATLERQKSQLCASFLRNQFKM